jgi:aspartate/methionine/tyrosine aminotransferase
MRQSRITAIAMRLRPFLLDQWIAGYADAGLPYNLAGSAGPSWTIEELLNLDPGSKERLLRLPVRYQPSCGQPALREALAEMSGVDPDEILVTAGGAEALFHVFFLAAGPGGNVIVPSPGFPTYDAIPEALGLELRSYGVLEEHGGFDVGGIKALTDTDTRLIMINSPHNPTGATVSADTLGELAELCGTSGIQLVVDEVFHPIYHGHPCPSASTLPHTTVINDLSKAFALPGLRIGWIREPDAARRAQYVNAREYLSVSNTAAGEFLAEIAVRHREHCHGRTQAATDANLLLLDRLMEEKSSALSWSRPQGGTTAFIRFKDGLDTRPLCVAAAERGLLLLPGDCFGFPDHVRVGLGASPDVFAAAMRVLAEIV